MAAGGWSGARRASRAGVAGGGAPGLPEGGLISADGIFAIRTVATGVEESRTWIAGSSLRVWPRRRILCTA
jgi:hypothetical protein